MLEEKACEVFKWGWVFRFPFLEQLSLQKQPVWRGIQGLDGLTGLSGFSALTFPGFQLAVEVFQRMLATRVCMFGLGIGISATFI